MKQIKIILFVGGFAGDLITALHDMDTFKQLTATGKVEIKEELKLLQEHQKGMTTQEKDQYLRQHQIISCCDPEFALKHREQTLMITCEDINMSKYFCYRFFSYHPYDLAKYSREEYHELFLSWKKFWSAKFKNKLDISDIFTRHDFIGKLNTSVSDEKLTLFNDWKAINQKIFLDHKATYGL